jgi:exodeoxyribonuclease-1
MNQPTFFFYDLETSGLSAREDRIMQFAGQRTDMDLQPIGEPVNLLVKLSDDTLPSPGAIMVTKITPQSTQQDGLTEAEFCDYLMSEIFTPNTCIVGYNSVRFDDEFIRHLFWRNFYDPYEWQWSDGRSRWDLLDVVRLTRALRPEGINWPFQEKTIKDSETGQKKTLKVPTNRLELITKLNNIEHTHAHDALSDVEALISVTQLIRDKQPQLYDYLFEIRNKRRVQSLVNLENKKPFVYASGRYPSKFEKTTVAFPLAPAQNGNVLVFDLRYNLDKLLEGRQNSAPDTAADATTEPQPDTEDFRDIPTKQQGFFPVVKTLCYNKCPAVAPLGVLEQGDGWQKIGLSREEVEQNLKALLAHPEFAEQMRTQAENRPEFPPAIDPESALYDGFLSDNDRTKCDLVRSASRDVKTKAFSTKTAISRLSDLHPDFTDERLPELLLHYKAKNFPTTLSDEESATWESYRTARLSRQAPAFLKQMEDLSKLSIAGKTTTSGLKIDPFLLEELTLWYQSLLPNDYN